MLGFHSLGIGTTFLVVASIGITTILSGTCKANTNMQAYMGNSSATNSTLAGYSHHAHIPAPQQKPINNLGSINSNLSVNGTSFFLWSLNGGIYLVWAGFDPKALITTPKALTNEAIWHPQVNGKNDCCRYYRMVYLAMFMAVKECSGFSLKQRIGGGWS